MDILAELNEAQKEATEAITGPVLILAGPGSGKTRVVAHRIAYLIKVCGVSPYRIMAVTFTNKAAREMEDRLKQLIRSAANNLTLGTFHAICARILRMEGKAIGIDTRFVIYDEEDRLSLLKRSMQEADVDPKHYAPRAIASAISAAKSHMLGPEEFLRQGCSYFEEMAGRVYELYQQSLAVNSALDFDDLLMKVVVLFRNSSEILSRYQKRYLYLHVDEFQDTNLVQYALIKQIADKHHNICVVGDPDQSIYSWRFADVRNILNFEKDYPEAKVVLLEQNYRSTKKILELASHLISANQQRKPKDLWTTNDTGELATVVETCSEQEEAQFVVNEIERLVENNGVSLRDCAVMYRTNAQSRVLEEAFVRYGMPYKLVAGTRFYERKEIKDIIAYLRLINNPDDSVSLLRVINIPGRSIGKQSLIRLSAWAKSLGVSEYRVLELLAALEDGVRSGSPYNPRTVKILNAFLQMIQEIIASSQRLNLMDLFDLVIERSGYKDYILNGLNGEERWENILELRTVAQQYQDLKPPTGLTNFLEKVALISDVDVLDGSSDMVILITLHQAKGLEFPVVFIVGMEDNILPHYKSLDDPLQMEEERRLCYVGVTRAKRKIYLVRAFRRRLMGGNAINEPSCFLKDIPSYLISGEDSWRGEKSKLTNAVYDLNETAIHDLTIQGLRVGDRVRHPQFGDGTVVVCQTIGNDEEVLVDFGDCGVKKLLLSFAHLEKVE